MRGERGTEQGNIQKSFYNTVSENLKCTHFLETQFCFYMKIQLSYKWILL